MDQFDKVLEKLQKIEVSLAVTNEKLTQLTMRLEVHDKEVEDLKERVDRHDKIVGAIVIAVAMLGALVKFKII